MSGIKSYFKVMVLLGGLLVTAKAQEGIWLTSQETAKFQEVCGRYSTILPDNQGVMDVHQFNRQMQWKETLPFLMALQDKYLPSNGFLNLEKVYSQLLQTSFFRNLNDKEKKLVQHNYLVLKKHCRSNPIEMSETGAKVEDLVSRCWLLANDTRTFLRQDLFCCSEESIGFFLDVLVENSQTSGGCYQGHAGRLCQFYLLLLREVFIQV